MLSLLQLGNNTALLSDQEKHTILLTIGTGGIVSMLVCLIALLMAFRFKLHRYFVHRLAIYQVVSAFLYSSMCTLELVFINYDRNPDIYHPMCMAEAFLLEYTTWLKLTFTFCLTFHLFCFAVFYVDFKKLEVVYILLSVIGPLLFSWIPFVNEIYGQAGAWCWIQNWKDDNPQEKLKQGEIEQYALLYGPAMTCMLIAAIAVVLVIVVLICRVYNMKCCYRVDELEPLIKEQQRKKVFREILPLVAYPIFSFTFYIPAFINRLNGSLSHSASFTSFMWGAVSLPLIGLLAGVSLIVHIFILECPKWNSHNKIYRRRTYDRFHKVTKAGTDIFTTDTIASTRSFFRPPSESEIDHTIMVGGIQ